MSQTKDSSLFTEITAEEAASVNGGHYNRHRRYHTHYHRHYHRPVRYWRHGC